VVDAFYGHPFLGVRRGDFFTGPPEIGSHSVDPVLALAENPTQSYHSPYRF
jgi:hypothetical protein